MNRNFAISFGLLAAIVILLAIFLDDQPSEPRPADRPTTADEGALGETFVADPAQVDQSRRVDEKQIPAQVWGIVSTPQGDVAAQSEVSIFRVRVKSKTGFHMGDYGFYAKALKQLIEFRERGDVSSADVKRWQQPLSGDLSKVLEPISQTIADDLGRYQFQGLERGQYLVAAVAEGTLRTPAEQLIDLAESVQRRDVMLLAAASLTVTVRGAEGVAQDCRVMVRANCEKLNSALEAAREKRADEVRILLLNSPFVEGRTDANGQVHFQRLMPLDYNVSVQKQPRARGSQQLALTDHQQITIDLVPGAMISGLVVNSEGSAVEGAVANLRNSEPNSWYNDRHPLPQSLADATGHFRIASIPPGQYELTVKAEGHIEVLVGSIEVHADEEIPVEVVLNSGGVIRGIVGDQSGSPIPGIKVSSRSTDRLIRRRQGHRVAHTDEQGRFRFDILEPGEHHLTFSGEGWVIDQRLVDTGSDLLEVTLERAQLVSGRVVTLHGEPIEGARIDWLGGDSGFGFAASDSNGHFQLWMTKPALYLSVSAHGFARMSLKVEELKLEKPDTDLGDLVLSEAVRIEGRVLSPDGVPLSGARIQRRDFFWTTSWSTTDGSWSTTDGSFLLFDTRGRDFDKPLTLKASYPQLLDSDPVTIESREKHVTGVELALRWGGEVRGTVTGNGIAIAGARVTLSGEGRTRYVESTDELGQFLIGGLKAGEYSIQANADGFADTIPEKFELLAEESRQIDIHLLEGTQHVSGIVTDPTGTPVIGAKVTIWGGNRWITFKDGVTGVDGRFSIDQIAPGPVDLKAEMSGFAPGFKLEFDPAQGEVEIVLHHSIELRGIVIDQKTGDPIARARVRLEGERSGRHVRYDGHGMPARDPRVIRRREQLALFYTGPDGSFSIPQVLKADRYEVTVEANGYRAATVSIDIPRDGPVESVVIELDSGGQLIVEVVDPTNAPVEGARVSAVDLYRTGVFDPSIAKLPITSESDRNGRATLSGLEYGTLYSVYATHRLYKHPRHLEVELNEIEGSARVRVVLELGATIRGTVLDASGNPFPAGTISLKFTNGYLESSRARTKTDESGNYATFGLRAGTYEVVFQKGDLTIRSAPIEVTGTEVYTVDLSP